MWVRGNYSRAVSISPHWTAARVTTGESSNQKYESFYCLNWDVEHVRDGGKKLEGQTCKIMLNAFVIQGQHFCYSLKKAQKIQRLEAGRGQRRDRQRGNKEKYRKKSFLKLAKEGEKRLILIQNKKLE